MYNALKSSLASWNNRTTEREKIQHLYIVLAAGLIVVAGIFGLANQSLGRQILTWALIAAGVFLVNAISWALLQSFVILRVEPTPKAKSQTNKSSRKK